MLKMKEDKEASEKMFLESDPHSYTKKLPSRDRNKEHTLKYLGNGFENEDYEYKQDRYEKRQVESDQWGIFLSE